MIPISTDPADLVTLASTLTIGRYATTAGAVVWFYDYLLMFSAEFRYVLLKKWGLVKVLYLLNRYLTLFYLFLVLYQMDGDYRGPLSNQFCIFYDIATTILRAIQLFSSTLLILTVVQSLSLGSRYIKRALYAAFFAANLVSITFGIITLQEIYPSIIYIPSVNICSSDAPDAARWFFLSQMPFDFLLLAIELYYYWRLHRLISPAQPTKLLRAMYVDGLWYFVATIAVKLTTGLIMVLAQPSYWYITTTADLSFTSTFIARLVLHLRSVASPTSSTSFTEGHIGETLDAASRFVVTMPQQHSHRPEARNLEVQDSGSNLSGEHDEDEQWKHPGRREQDAIEMHGWNPQRTSLAPGGSLDDSRPAISYPTLH